jgi:hypothetical protein
LFNLRWNKISTSFITYYASFISVVRQAVLYNFGIGLVVIFCFLNPVFGQKTAYMQRFQELYDTKPIHYGFLFAVPVTNYTVIHNDAFNAATDSVMGVRTPNTTNFRMGFVINAFLDDHWDVRTTPSVTLYNRFLDYDMRSGRSRRETRESAWIEVPLLLKYKSQRRNNSRMYLIGGATFGFETNVRKRTPSGINRLAAKTTDLTLDYGFGFEQFLQYTKFSPEIRFSHGLLNAYVQPQYPATLGIKRLTTHTITFYLMFE